MSFSRWYPVSTFFYDPSIQPSKPIANLQQRDESQFRKVPKGRYDTTYRREYLNFGNSMPPGSGGAPGGQPGQGQYQQQQVQGQQSNPYQQPQTPRNANTLQDPDQQKKLNPYQVLPPISTPQGGSPNQGGYGAQSIDHIIGSAPPSQAENLAHQSDPDYLMAPHQPTGFIDPKEKDYLPIDPIYLSPQEEQALMNDVSRELGSYRADDLKRFYTELTSYDPNLSGFTHHTYIALVAMRNNLPLSEPLMRFVMSRFVSPNMERGFVNYEELIKFLARCLGDRASYAGGQANYSQYPPSFNMVNSPRANAMSGGGGSSSDVYDPDEQAILRQLHENMRDWDQVNLINCDQLRKKFYEIDPYNRYILTQREVEDVVYKNRIPIQRSLIFQILEKYCKVASGQYKWPAFVDFIEKTYNLRLTNKKKTHYVLREDEKEQYSSEYMYRNTQLDALRSKASEEERLEEINKQIYNLQTLKQETKSRIDSRLGDVVQGESWFTRFMRLANAMYSHRVNAGIEFALPKEEARRLITAYNTVYELNIPEHTIEEGLNRCLIKGNVVIDDLLKVLSKVQ